ncbi:MULTISPECIES: hypothetical protein [unclassified Pseudomonas]|uniref:hypothetical protein n=1 Tax=Pseudomonas TaxID=286 RepID=UPI001295ACAD|nr:MULTISPECIES: hypothetical protein [unclassified Pseudomonas]MDU7559099.1 hypothetical protein [Pseudomonas sp.]MQT41355.1 hypothetical protein [Pseudomonas sp. FSL R10-0765]MQT55329.1 hypothetical protein [Pseudomonas sp. FSL R10-2398]MQU03554.1 hypothetical protein [Pseudomonas sp. FSL R10-2245]MQU14613.1 hypothetical protein [Pseudomonas sp. FSL R10-2189]
MLINTQHTSAIQKTQRTDLDPANAAASALYSAAQQNAQPLTNLQATPASVAGNAQADNVNAAFAKTRVMLQASASSTGTATKTSATDEFKDYMSKSPAQRIREQLLKEMGLTEDDFKAMPPEKQQAITDQITALMQQKEAIKQAAAQQQVAEKQV